ncbi:hypothetical protein BCON_0359g00030 [Botryotinia convoluta]|uniref:Uncharacterized protein n=1 Tax=Botryotinia convoluta TaxID=54673 RepID=A0A4Z1HEV8_9HELO|nr:hypothetical protein BCON_0359g00030 [Botryotinia convoluta]
MTVMSTYCQSTGDQVRNSRSPKISLFTDFPTSHTYIISKFINQSYKNNFPVQSYHQYKCIEAIDLKMTSRGTSSALTAGLEEQKKKTQRERERNPGATAVPAGQRRAASRDRTKTKTGGNVLPTPPPTGQTHKLGQGFPRNAKAPTSFDGRAYRDYPSDESRRGNKSPSINSDEENRTYPGIPDDIFTMSGLEDQLPASGEKTKSKSPPGVKAAPKKGLPSSKAVEPTPAKKPSTEKTPAKRPVKERRLSSDSSFADSESSLPKSLSQQGRRRTGDRGSSKRGTSEERKRKGNKSSTDPAKASNSK